ncbi:MAG: tetratricopeptide repeat protein [Patescibacteria group bacterium]|nr:tetratricopeptide repeat protein [Patescibacteria group bacterium]
MEELSNNPSSVTSVATQPTESKISKWLGRLVDACLYVAVVAVPLWYMPNTLDVLELNKQTLLVVLSMVALIAWLGKAVLDKKFSLTRSWLHLVVAVFFVGYLVTSLFSADRYLSLVGNFGQMQWSFVTIASFVVFYLVAVNRIQDTTRLYHLVLAFLGSSLAVVLYGLLQIFGIYPLAWAWPITAAKSFNSVGTINSLAMFLTIPLVLSASLTILGCKDEKCILGQRSKGSVAAKVLVWATMVLPLVFMFLVDFWPTWVTLLFGTLVLVGITFARTRSIKHPVKIIVPSVLAVVSAILLIWPTPIKLELPAEVSPSATHSWNIAKQSLQQKPFFGTGPGTWIYDYSKFRAPSVNLSQFWTIRFERGLSTFYTLLATIGIVGTSLWLLLLLSAIFKSAVHLVKEKGDDEWQAYLTVFAGWLVSAFIAFFYNYNFSHHFVFWFLLALLASLVAKNKLTLDGQKKPAVMTTLSVVLIVVSVCAVSVLWLSGQRLVADAAYSKAVISYREGRSIDDSISRLQTAVSLNRLNDAYHRNLSQAYLIKVNEELNKVNQQPDQDQTKAILKLVNDSRDNALKATEISPNNVDNWANLAIIYQAVASFMPGADELAITNFEKALDLEPNNPVYYNEIGKLYIMRSDAYKTLLLSKDEAKRKEAETNVKAELDKAAEQLNQAVQAKPDFAAAHYNLAILYERQERLKDAIDKMLAVLKTNNRDIGVGFQLGILYYRDGQKDQARDIFEQIVALEPNYSNARWYLSVLYEEEGRYDDAIAQVQEVQKLNAGNQTVEQRLDSLMKARDAKAKPAATTMPEPVKEEVSGPKPLNEVKNP